MKIRTSRKLSTSAGLGVSLAALAAFAAACGGSDSSGSSPASSSSASAPAPKGGGSSAVAVDEKTGSLGTYLSDSAGRTLYLFAADTGPASTCDGACAAQWPPLTVKNAPAAGTGINSSDLTTLTRPDGSRQVAYHGHPLYYFKGDSAAGQTNGQGINGFGANWYVVSPAGARITQAASVSTGGSGSGAGGY